MYAPYQWWDAIEQAEIHYVAAYIGWRLNKKLIEAGQLSSAEYLYRDVLSKLPKRLIFVRAASRALRAEAQAGLDRVTLARTGKYDSNWLMSD